MKTQNNDKNNSRFARIISYLKNYRRYLILGALSLILTNSLMLLVPYISKIVIDLLENNEPLSEVRDYVLLMVGLSVLAGIFRFLTRRTIIWMSRKIEYDLRGEIVSHLMALSPSFYDRTRTGDLMVRVTSDLEAVRMMIGPGIMHVSNTIITMLIAIPMMIILSSKLTLYAAIPAIVIPVLVNRLGNLVHKKSTAIQEHFSKLTATAQENLAGIRVVKAYRQERNEIENFDRMSDEYRLLNISLGKIQAAFYPVIQFIGFSLTLVVLYFGGREVINGQIPLGTIVAFLAYLGMLVWPMMAVGWVVSLYQRGTASLERINKIFREESDIDDMLEQAYREKVNGSIRFENLTFSYNGQPVLKDISLEISSGETVGVLGHTGSGKTTLVSLLARMYPIEKGMIFIDNIDINNWSLKRLREHIGFATQEPFLFSDSLSANISFGQDNPSIEKVEEVAEVAALAKDIDQFPKKYETVVGERGITLSGGQKQRTAIARSILIEPSILILDDATSSVDTETEHEINERIHRYSENLTTLIISHRVSSVKEADKIIFLDKGTIIESGTHDELIKLNGMYAELYRSQLLEQELEQLQ